MLKRFNDWVASWLPGFKTQATASLLVALSAGSVGLEYITTLSQDQIQLVVGKFAPYVGMGAGLLVLYFRWLANRIENAVDNISFPGTDSKHSEGDSSSESGPVEDPERTGTNSN